MLLHIFLPTKYSLTVLIGRRGISMTEYRVRNAIVRMHGTPDCEKVRAAAEQFLKAVEQQRQQTQRKEGR